MTSGIWDTLEHAFVACCESVAGAQVCHAYLMWCLLFQHLTGFIQFGRCHHPADVECVADNIEACDLGDEMCRLQSNPPQHACMCGWQWGIIVI